MGLYAAGVAGWLAFLIVAVALLLIAAILAGIGYLFIRRVKGPDRTIAQANLAATEVKGAAEQALAAAKAPQIEGEVVSPRRAIT